MIKHNSTKLKFNKTKILRISKLKNSVEKNMKLLFENGKTLMLAYDQGLEHGPEDLNLKNCNPEYIFEIADKGKFKAIVVGSGIAEKYYPKYKNKFALVVKLNGKTKLTKNEPFSPQNCSVERAFALGASAVGYTIFPGSSKEEDMFRELGRIVEEAHALGIPVIVWSYPRGSYAPQPHSNEMIAYAARIALELGADAVKLFFNKDKENMKWVVGVSGKMKVLTQGGNLEAETEVLQNAYDAIGSGTSGMIIGRNIWQHDHPIELALALRKIIFENSAVDEAMEFLK